jgi:hypothetical protein
MNKKDMIRLAFEEMHVPEKKHYLWMNKNTLNTIKNVNIFLNSIENDYRIEYATITDVAYFEEPNGEVYPSGSYIAVSDTCVYANNLYGTTCRLPIKDILKEL